VADPSDYCPAYPFGAGELTDLVDDAETPAKKRKLESPSGPSGSASGKNKKSKYKEGPPPKKYPLLNRTFGKFFGKGEHEKSRILYASLSDATWGRYETSLKLFNCYLHQTKRDVYWPMNEKELSDLLIWMDSRKNLSGNTIESYFSSIRSIQTLVGLSPAISKTGEKRIKALLQGIKNLRPPKNQKQRQAVTTGFLRWLRERTAGSGWTGSTKKAFWTCCLTAFFGSFRIGELLATSTNKGGLRWGEIEIVDKEFVRVKIDEPKTGGGGTVGRVVPGQIEELQSDSSLKTLKKFGKQYHQGMPPSPDFHNRRKKTFDIRNFSQTAS